LQSCHNIHDIKTALDKHRQSGQSIAIVPTMGYLHEGHLSLVRTARRENDIVVATIFVNPTQFGPQEDFERYPRDEERDMQLLEQEDTDYLFIPSIHEIYPEGFSTYVTPPEQSQGWCGDKRPGHFQGVCTVVSILFNIVEPQRGYFGQKDAQQLAVLRQMAKDLHFPIEVIGCPIVREEDGLAMSSRNVYLSPDQRKQALILSKTLKDGIKKYQKGQTSASAIIKEGKQQIASATDVRLDYLGIADQNTFSPVTDTIKGGDLFLGAIYIGNTRLIDNMEFTNE
jgi:pantoate--beta-alanine ligase